MNLSTFEGRDVASATMRLTGAGDGLSKALGIKPAEYHVGDVVRVVIEGRVVRVAHDPVKDSDLLVRVHTVKADLAVIVDGEVAYEVIDAHRLDLERAAGVERLPFHGDDGEKEEEP